MKIAEDYMAHIAVPDLLLKRMAIWFGSLSVSIAIVLCMAATVQASLACDRCHGMPPVDASFRDLSTGRFIGSHSTHAWVINGVSNCGKCHKMSTASDHRNGKIDMVNNINNSRLTARYKNMTSWLQDSDPVPDTCMNVNCHFESQTPQRGRSPLSRALVDLPTTCNTCHGSPPASGAHQKHAGYYGGVLTACVKCHPDHIPEGSPFGHATSAGKRGLLLQFVTTPNSGGAYSGDISYPLYLYNQSRNGSCSGLYCHSNGRGGAPNMTPSWSSSFGTSCSGCHRGDALSGAPMNSGSHLAHVGNGAVTVVDCMKCHNLTVSDSRTISDISKHLNQTVDVAFDASIGGTNGFYNGLNSPIAKANNTAFGRCKNIYCHSNGSNTTPPFNNYTTPVWGGSSLPVDCTGCHGNNASSSKVNTSGNHRKHIDASFNAKVGTGLGCVECHAKTVGDDRTIIDKTKHVNGFKDFSGLRAGRISGGVCNTVYCHSSGQRSPVYRTMVLWSDTNTVYTCTSCHGASTSGPAGVVVSQFGEPNYINYSSSDRNWFNSHNKHVAVNNDCRKCHFNTTQDGVTLVPGTTLHVNSQKNVSFDTAVAGNSSPTYDDQTRRCGNVYCHSNGIKTGTAYISPRWGGAPFTCNSCHPIASLSGAHATHLGGMIPNFYNYTGNHPVGNVYRFGCSNCHPLDKAAFHNNGSVNLALSNNAAGIGNLRSRNGASTDNGPNAVGSGIIGTSGLSIKCTAVYCHSNGYASKLVYATTPDWYGGSFSGDRCANCHGNFPNTTIAGSPAHYDANNWLGSGKPGGHIVGLHYGNIYNGGNGLATAGNTNTSSHGLGTNSTTFNCHLCHNDTITVANNDMSANCSTASCHDAAPRLKGNAAIASAVTHVNGQVDVKFLAVNAISKAQVRNAPAGWTRNNGLKAANSFDQHSSSLASANYTAGTKSCANVACHFKQTIKWTDTGGATTCMNCHTAL